MVKIEMGELEVKLEFLEIKMKVVLLLWDFNDDKNIMLEIRVGIGGDEVSIWVGDFVRMYFCYLEI